MNARDEVSTIPPDEVEVQPSAVDVARWASRSERLRQRRFELLPLRGDGALVAGPQGRPPSSSTIAPADLVELISSIAEIGVLQPVLVEQVPSKDDAGGVEHRLVAGERRLRAAQWGAVHLPENPHFAALPAVVCPGPLTEEECRIWQLVENIAREDLQPGELAAALLFERCAILATRLVEAGVTVGDDLFRIDDPVKRWGVLEQRRVVEAPQVGAPWPDVLRRLGIQMRHETATRLVRALGRLPPELSADMDAHEVALATRLAYLRLDRGRAAAAREVWEAVKARGRADLLAAALHATQDGVTDPDEAVDQAAALHQDANEARRSALTRPAASPLTAEALGAAPAGAGDLADDDGAVVADALAAMKRLVETLRSGWRPRRRYDAGSLRLHAHQIADLLNDDGLNDDGPSEDGQVESSAAAVSERATV